VGPIFVGHSIDNVLLEQSRQYKSYNAVEGNHVWKLHVEADIGVPLAPSAMDERSYIRPVDENANIKLHPDDDALLNWTGSMGDTAAEDFKRYQEQARAAARLSVLSSTQQRTPTKTGPSLQQSQTDKKKTFSRVLKEDMQTWMKKTTYLSNDYSRKVHDFKSLAQTKSELASDLQAKQMEMAQRRSVKMVAESFEVGSKHQIEHPTNKELKAVREYQVLPDATNWGRTFTHVVIDKIATTLPAVHSVNNFNHAFITNVERKQQSNTTRMTCTVIVPSNDTDDDHTSNNNNDKKYRPIQSYDLDVLPLKEEDEPHMNFTIRLNKLTNIAYYIPIASRVQLSMGRPSSKMYVQPIERRVCTDEEVSNMEVRVAEIDQDMAEKHHIMQVDDTANNNNHDNDDDGEGDYGDEDSTNDNDEVFGVGAQTIVAES
jgi:Paf1